LADSLSEQLDDAEKLFETTAAGEEEQQARRGETIGPDQGRVLIVIGCLVGPGGYSIVRRRA
jgi:hypothetical protein